jgi:hypothetical protein
MASGIGFQVFGGANGRGRGARALLRRFPLGALTEDLAEQPLGAAEQEIKRRTNAVRIFPTERSMIRVVEAVLSEQHDERQIANDTSA